MLHRFYIVASFICQLLFAGLHRFVCACAFSNASIKIALSKFSVEIGDMFIFLLLLFVPLQPTYADLHFARHNGLIKERQHTHNH